MLFVKRFTFFLMLALMSYAASGQRLKSMPLTDLSGFKPQAGNWHIVGEVTMNPSVSVHEEPAPGIPETTKKKGKKEKPTATPSGTQAVVFKTGTGILLNINDASKKDALISAFEHGDLDLELEVMLPKGSNSGIYLQGRYEVQLLDSWGVKDPKFSDIGGIYRNWETEKGKIYMGKAPLSNPAKAPGLWQKMRISFQAPKFNAAGEKIANAKFIFVELNGVRIHDNVEVPLPTGGPIENNEKPTGPLMIQGDHGPVAFRNIKYRLLKDINVSLSDISYKTFEGKFRFIADFANAKPATSGTTPQLTCEVLENDNAYGSIYSGKVTVPEDGNYRFLLTYTGGGRLVIDGKQLINYESPDGWWRKDTTSIELKAGSYPFEIYNYKDASWMPPRLGFFATMGVVPQPLHAFLSFPPDDNAVSPILINPGSSPRLLRAFLDFRGSDKQRLTHTIGVGDPSGTHYIYDLKAGNLVCVWHGDFVDATPMWHDRGDGSFRPMGAVQYLFTSQPLAFLDSESAPFPKITKEAMQEDRDYRGKGYELEEATGRPLFKYTYKGIDVEDKIYPSDDSKNITHEVTVKNRGAQQGLHYKLAEGKVITELTPGFFAVDDQSYYIKTGKGITPRVREVNGVKELITPVSDSFSYSIIW